MAIALPEDQTREISDSVKREFNVTQTDENLAEKITKLSRRVCISVVFALIGAVWWSSGGSPWSAVLFYLAPLLGFPIYEFSFR